MLPLPWSHDSVEDNRAFFFPPLHSQRKHFIAHYIRENLANSRKLKLLDVGCGEGSLLRYLKNDHIYERLVGVDRDANLLKTVTLPAVRPNVFDELQGGLAHRFGIDLLHADVIQVTQAVGNENLTLENDLIGQWLQSQRFDVCVCTEMIEHVHLGEELMQVEKFLFNVANARVIIVTTPNFDFNDWFKHSENDAGGDHVNNRFRHDDHKFEFTREEFQQWVQSVLERFPRYRLVQSTGVGTGPGGDRSHGFATQIAIFELEEPQENIEFRGLECNGTHEWLSQVDYPVDERTEEQKVVDECFRRCYHAGSDNPYTVGELCQYVQTLEHIPPEQQEVYLRECLKSEYAYEMGLVILENGTIVVETRYTATAEDDYYDEYSDEYEEDEEEVHDDNDDNQHWTTVDSLTHPRSVDQSDDEIQFNNEVEETSEEWDL